jgi:hypothetical protein
MVALKELTHNFDREPRRFAGHRSVDVGLPRADQQYLRCRMLTFRLCAIASCLSTVLATACQAPGSEEVESPDLSLLFAEQPSAVDSLAREMIRRQRQLFEILLSDERRRLADYLEVDFGWGPPPATSVSTSGAIIRRAGPSTPSGYFAFLAGFTPPPLTAIPTDYRVRSESDLHVTVLAGPVADGAYLATYWRRLNNTWRAIRMVAVPKEYVDRVTAQQR